MLDTLRRELSRHENAEGATAVEYGIMVALIAVVIIGAVFLLGQRLNTDFSCVGESVANAPAPGASCP